MKRRLSTIFYSQTNDQIERQNQILKYYLRVFCNEQQNDWANLLFIAEYVYQQSQYKTLNYSLFYVMYDYNLDFELRIENDSPQEKMSAAKERVKEIYALREELAKRWQKVFESQAKTYNNKH